ncbi:MAG: histidine phosphatase family protein [Chloroflexota bacterium]
MTAVILVRHAATAWSGVRYLGRADLPLTTEGIEATRRMAAALAASVPAGVRIVASPSGRAHATAEIIAEALGDAPPAIETDARWAEADVGEAEGLTFVEVEERFPSLARQLADAETDIDWPAGETGATFHERIASAWTAVQAAGSPTIVVSHAGPIRAAIALASGRAAAEIPFPTPGEAIRLEIDAGLPVDDRRTTPR